MNVDPNLIRLFFRYFEQIMEKNYEYLPRLIVIGMVEISFVPHLFGSMLL